MHKIFNKKNKFTLKDVDETQEDHSTPSFSEYLSNKANSHIHDDKICIGDKVQITTNKLTNLKGTVMYIGYPFSSRTARYGINLEKAKGEHNGSLMLDIKTEKVITKPSHLRKYKKRIKKRSYFKAKSKHGILVKKNEISSIDRLATSTTRFTVEDQVEVRFRGIGKIKFIGMLEHTKEMGVWYGIQLTDRRGRHDGTVNGVKYFVCPPQYGLHTRQNHLTLLESEEKNNSLDVNNFNAKRKSIGDHDKKQVSNKWAKVLGANEVKGFAIRYVSAINLTDPKHKVMVSDTIETTNASVLSLKLGLGTSSTSTNMIVPHIKNIGTMASLSNILPPNMNFANGISVNVLPGMHHNKKKSEVSNIQSHSGQPSASEHASVKRGGTLAVLPGYSTRFKEKKFFDYFDFDEIEDELGEGEFGVVYKCRKVDIEEEDEYEYSTTLKTATKYGSTTNTYSVYPGDIIDEDAENDSDSMSVSYSSSDEDDEDKYFAVKKIKKAKFHHLNYQHKQETIKLLQQEIKLLEKIQHLKKRKMEGSQYIVDLMDVFEDRNYLYIVTNFCSGGNLWANIEDEQHSEKTIQSIMKQILEGLAFLHRHKIAHLDLKPDNIMFNADNEIQLIDFGMSRMIPPLHKAGVLVGTPNFVAPEVIQGFYDKKADVWSVGIIFFMLRFGYPPFFEGTSSINYKSMDDSDEEKQKSEHEKLFTKIKKGFDPSVKPGLGAWFPSEIPVGEQLKDLISKMLCSDLAKRLTAAECLTHPYFKTLADSNKLPLTIMDALTKFQGQCEFNVMVAKLFAHQIETNEMEELEECWNKFDKKGNGSLTLEQFKSVMREYDHGYEEYQIEAMFASLDWNETDMINFNSLLTAFSYQRLVAVDERLWEAFSRLDVDNDGHITKAEIKRVLAIVNPKAFDDGIKQLNLFKPVNDNINNNITKLSAAERRQKNISMWIGDCMISADWDDDGQIDYEEFLRALHPRFNESPVTPPALKSPSQVTNTKFIFQPSLGTGINYGNGNNQSQTNKGAFDTYLNEHKVQNE